MSQLPPELSRRIRSGVDIEEDEASSEEGRDVVERGVEGERGLDRARDGASKGRVVGPGDRRPSLTHCTRMKVCCSHAIDIGSIKIA